MEIREVKNEIEINNTEKYRGAVIRARAVHLWMGETPKLRALSVEKRYVPQKEIKDIRLSLQCAAAGKN